MGQPEFPSSAPTSSQVEAFKTAPSYRDVQPLPAQVLENCTVCIEENLFSEAIPILFSAATAGNGTARPAYVPPTQHLSLLATLTVHPSMTTRTLNKEKHTAADDALQYLRHLKSLTSADTSGLTKALQFRDAGSSRSKRARTRHSDISSDDDNEDPGRIRSIYAGRESLFANTDDFWAAVGWAFNCSVAHKNRWDRWRLWLEFMLDVLEDDLTSKYHATRLLPEKDKVATMSESLLATYLAPFVDSGRNPKRRIMRAILADGTQSSLNQFPSIYVNETRPPKAEPDAKIGSKRSLDLDQGDFGDYFDSESDSNTTPGPGTKSGRTSARHSSANLSRQDSPATAPGIPKYPTSSSSSLASHGGPESLHLRLRLLSLLTTLSTLAPALFLDPEDLFDIYTEFLRPLPLPVFSYIILSPTSSKNPKSTTAKSYFDANSLASLTQMLLRPLLSSAAPISNANSLTAETLATNFAPFAANVSNVGENARVGICVEGLLRLLWGEGVLGNVDNVERKAVRKAVEDGIKTREEKAGGDGRRKSGSKEAEGWEALMAGAERMKCLLEMI